MTTKLNKARVAEIERYFYDYVMKQRSGPQFSMSDFDMIRELTDFAFSSLTERPEVVENAVATVEKTCVGPKLFVNGVFVHWWLGTMHDEFADKLAAEINASRSPLAKPK